MSRADRSTEQAFERDLERRRRIRHREIDRLVEQARRRGGVVDRLYWTMVHDFELAPVTTNRAQLAAIGIEVPPACELDDQTLSTRLWEVIRGLARLRVFLLDTEHLDDRALYDRLEREILREEVREVPPEPGVREYIDLGSGDPSVRSGETACSSPVTDLPGRGRDDHLPRPTD